MAALQILAMPLGIAAVVRLALTRNESLSFVPPSVKQTTRPCGGASPSHAGAVRRLPRDSTLRFAHIGGSSTSAGAANEPISPDFF